MQVTVECIAVSPNEYEGKKGLVRETVCSMIDRTDGIRVTHAFDYVLSSDEQKRFGGWDGDKFGKCELLDRRLVLGVERFEEWGGTPRFRGRIMSVEGSLGADKVGGKKV